MSSTSRLESSLSLDAVRRIDQLCDRFEAELQAGRRPDLAEFLVEIGNTEQEALLASLLEVELEYRRAWGERPAAEDYVNRFSEFAEVVHSVFDGHAAEPVDPTSKELSLLQLALANASGRRIDRLRIYQRGKLVHTDLLGGPLELGRQRPDESAPFAATQGKHGDRLVIAPLEETTISRRHIYLAPEGDNDVLVTNLSQINPILFSNGGRLNADQTQTFCLPLEMTIGVLFVRIDRPAPKVESSDGTAPAHESNAAEAESAQQGQGLLQRIWNRGR